MILAKIRVICLSSSSPRSQYNLLWLQGVPKCKLMLSPSPFPYGDSPYGYGDCVFGHPFSHALKNIFFAEAIQFSRAHRGTYHMVPPYSHRRRRYFCRCHGSLSFDGWLSHWWSLSLYVRFTSNQSEGVLCTEYVGTYFTCLGATICVKLGLLDFCIIFNNNFGSASNLCLCYTPAKCGR